MRRRVDRLVSAGLQILALATSAACTRPEGEGATDAVGDAADDGTTGADEPYPTPVLLEPSSEAVRIDADRSTPLLLSALGTVAGRTQITVDGRTLAVADQDSPFGALSGGIGRIDLRGAMVESRHTLRLVTPGEVSRLESRAVDLVVVPRAPGRVAIEVSSTRLAPSVIGGAVPLATADGSDPSAPPAWWTWTADDLDPTLGLASVRLTFSRSGAADHTVELTSLARDADGRPWVRVGAGAQSDTAVIAWLTGPEARVAWRRVIALDAVNDTVTSPPVVLLDLDDPSLDALAPTRYEVASLRGVAVLEGRALVELDARLDAEANRPGDHVVAVYDPVPDRDANGSSPLAGADRVDGAIVSLGGPVDLELVGDLVDVDARARGLAGLAVRIAGDRPRPLEWQDGVASLRVNDDDARDGRPAIAARWAGATLVLGSLASRTWLARTNDDELALVAYDARSPSSEVELVPLDAPLTVTPTAVVLSGRIVALLPLGPAVDAVALTVSGTNHRQTVLDGLRCSWTALGAVAEDGSRARWLCGDGVAVREGIVSWVPEE